MKRPLLLLTTALLVAVSAPAQNLQLSSYVTAISGDNDSLLHSTAVLHNTGSSSIDVLVDKFENLASFHSSYFCWAGLCYDTATTTSVFSTTLGPGDSSIVGPSGFIAYLKPNQAVGTSEVTYNFYDESNPADSASITFNYTVLLLGIREMIASGVTLTNPSPNPASGFTQIGFNLTSGKNAKIVVYNMLGLAVKEIRVSDRQKLLSLNTGDLKNGLYIYSLVNDEKVIASKKLMVNHR